MDMAAVGRRSVSSHLCGAEGKVGIVVFYDGPDVTPIIHYAQVYKAEIT